ncbi:type II toxin-antitoxin system Phd/YefM family antitoxin [Lacihabitans sp. LS3-19]|uniref:type II toxin-antitoxin system Phd/YefM family antitoxin n=1 Tax=Lacihabitans sp. LS3-19 TaxID=2487335 RepID=UPI0020CC77BA|nr:hypothetical protein [Lacihabitans sp. LS3-19]MCP9766538.1 type II toxin-antitoxin system Phd/YefM family antitoxin [Lacihabitans sp. LS3-19]
METVNVHDAISQLLALINRVLSDEKKIISRNNQPLVELTPLVKQKRIPGKLKDKIKILGNWEESEVSANELFINSVMFPKEKNTN